MLVALLACPSAPLRPQGADASAARASTPTRSDANPQARGQATAKYPPGVDTPEQPETGALLLLSAGQLLRLDQQGLAVVDSPPDTAWVELLIGPDGEALGLSERALYRIEGPQLSKRASFDEALAPVQHVALGPQGELWLSAAQGVGTGVAGRWELSSREDLGFAADADLRLAFDHEGRLWASDGQQGQVREGDAWGPVELAWLGEGAVLLNLLPSPAGRVHVNNHHRLTRLGTENHDSVLIDPTRAKDYTFLSIGPTGHAAVATSACDLGRSTPTPPTLIWRFSAEDYACQTLEAIALDGQLRLWVASREGLSVIEDTRLVHEYPPGSFAALKGPVTQMIAVGDGPALPPMKPAD